MYSFTGQNQYGSYNSTYASSPAAAAVYNAAVQQAQPTVHNPQLGNVGVSNPSSVYASFSGAVAPTASPYATAAYANPGAAAAAAATYAQYSQTVASMQQQQQQQQQHQVQQQMQVAGGVVSASVGYPGQNATRLTDSFSTVAPVASTGGTYTPLTDYTSSLRSAAAAAAAVATNPVNNPSYVGMTRIGTSPAGQIMNTVSSATGTSGSAGNYTNYDAAVYAAASNYLHSKAVGTGSNWMNPSLKKGPDGYGNLNSMSNTNSTNIPITGSGRGFASQRGRGTFPNKRYGQNRSGDVQQFYCEVCKISCAGSQTYKEHMDGQKHKKKEALQKGEGQTLSKSRVSFRCETCNVTCTGKDTYDSHVRGTKHQKTANLMKKLGKPVPDVPTVLAPGEKSNKRNKSANGAPIATVGGPAVPTKRVVGVSTMKFVGGDTLQTTGQDTTTTSQKTTSAAEAAIEASGLNNAAVEAALAAEKEVQPVGEDYVEEERNAAGKLVQYNCKLCDCKFSDPNAKNIHIKGRKHRLQYKMKVNPSLVVEMKPNQVPRDMRGKMRGQRMSGARALGPPQPLMMADSRPWYDSMQPTRQVETSEDLHVIAKHQMIYPEEEQLLGTEKLISMTEKALKCVSDKLAEEDAKKAQENADDNKAPVPGQERVLKGVMRVGLLAKGLLLKTDREVQLVVLCSQPPTMTLLSEIGNLLPSSVKKGENEVVTVIEKPDESSILLKHSSSDMICRIVLTCAALRDAPEPATGEGDEATAAAGAKATPLKDPLPKVPCLEALAEQRHAKWFQARCSTLQSATITLRILRDIRQRVPSWRLLKSWATELLVAKVLVSAGVPVSPGEAIRRVFEAVASGILFKDGPGLIDPCEKEPIDILSDISGQQREDITSSSQHALRLIAFNQLYKVLGIERIADQRLLNSLGDRKRPRDSNGNTDDGEDLDVKKDKKDDDTKATEQQVA